MENKVKFILIGLVGVVVISLFASLQLYASKNLLEKEKKDLEKENAALAQQIEESRKYRKDFEEKINSLNLNLRKITKEKDELQKRFELVTKEREELVERLKSRREPMVIKESSPASAAAPSVPITQDTYWADLLRAKTDLELQVTRLREDLSSLEVSSEQLQRERGSLELEVSNLNRDKQDLIRELEYNQKIMDTMSQELVREKNDKFQIIDSIKDIKNENAILRRQLSQLNNSKTEMEKQFMSLKAEESKLKEQLSEAESSFKSKMLQISNLKRQFEVLDIGEETGQKPKESVELPPIVVRPQTEEPKFQEEVVAAPAATEVMPMASFEGKVLAVNKPYNFIVVDLGQDSGVRIGQRLKVYRDNKPIGAIEIMQIRNTISAGDIKEETTPIKVGDIIK